MDQLADPEFHHDLDVFAVADYLLRLDKLRPEPDVTPLKLAKLLYLAQANYLASTNKRMFAEDVEAFEHGPCVYREWKRHRGKVIIVERYDDFETESSPLPVDVMDFLDAIWAKYKDYSPSQLWALTHGQAPWNKYHREGGYRTVIPDGAMTSYFRDEVPARDRIFHPSVVVLPDDIFDDEAAEQFAARLAEYTGP